MRSRPNAVNHGDPPKVDGHRWRSAPPSACLLCQARVDAAAGLCAGCRGDLPLNAPCCRRCAAPLPEPGVCGPCLRDPGPDEAWSPLVYAPPVDGLLRALKFGGRLEIGDWLGAFMAERIVADSRDLPELLVPVPLHRRRQARRGFNQALEIARPLGRRLGIPLDARCCRRHAATAPQAGLDGRARGRNVRRAFRLRRRPDADHVAIVDDILTTGATTAALAGILHAAGVERVDVWTAARTP